MNNIKITLFALFCLAFVSACQEQEIEPEDVATNFFTAIYVDGDIDAARSYASDDIGELLAHYHSAQAVKRHVIGLNFPASPEITVKETTADFFRKLKTSVRVTMHFRAVHDGGQYEDIRQVVVSKVGEKQWKVVEIKPDKFSSGG